MRTGGRQRLGWIAAFLGVLGLLLFGAFPAMAHAPLAHSPLAHSPLAHAPQVRAAGPVAATHQHHAHLPAASAPSEDCPPHHARACCNVAGCTSTVAMATDQPYARMWRSSPDAFACIAARVPAGVEALPLTPPPRRTG